MRIVVVGAGAAGFFGAIQAAATFAEAEVILLEKSAQPLAKVRVSGGGRCNVTHACFDPKLLVSHYPRGHKELLGPFHRFQPKDTMDWFAQRGVDLKIEKDGRVFPQSDSSQSIIDCLLLEAKRQNVSIRYRQKIEELKKEKRHFVLVLGNGEVIECDRILLATGSHSQGYDFAKNLGHHIVSQVPSLFTFQIPHFALKELSGISMDLAEVSIPQTSYTQKGPLLITHWGFSGPAVLKLSAWAARFLNEKSYQQEIVINWIPETKGEEILLQTKKMHPHSSLLRQNPFHLPRQLWKYFLESQGLSSELFLGDIANKTLIQLVMKLQKDSYFMDGKITHKEEFVTCGGVFLNEVNFKTMESRICPGLYFAGEILDIDGVTGGFNFQNAWTSGWIAGSSIGLEA